MTKSTVVPFELPSEFSPDPLTEVIQAGAKELLRTGGRVGLSAENPFKQLEPVFSATDIRLLG